MRKMTRIRKPGATTLEARLAARNLPRADQTQAGSSRLMMGSIRTRRWHDKEQPRGDDTAGETRQGGGDQPVQAATGLDQEGEPGNANEHGGDRVRGEPFDVEIGRASCRERVSIDV